MKIQRLFSGGIITNYYCTSRCKHCLYNCTPSWSKDYMEDQNLKENIRIIKELGCCSVHIGGGEPFLDFEKLINVVKICRQERMGIEYIETNSSWYRNNGQSVEQLKEIKKHGITTLLISMSPFHNEFIPFIKVKEVIKSCQQIGIRIFPWTENFYHEIDRFDDQITHSLEEYEAEYGSDYIRNIPLRYWISYGGRALKLFSDKLPHLPLDEILLSEPCHELSDTSHFHMDLYGNYIPGLCSGLQIKKEDLGKTLPVSYKLIHILFNDGIRGLYELALLNDFKASNTYFNKCHLCYEIRNHLIKNDFVSSDLLLPEFYFNY